MNVQNLTNQEITLLEIFLNNYKHARVMMKQIPQKDRTRKAIKRATTRFEEWITSLKPDQVRFLKPFGLDNALEEVRQFNTKSNPFQAMPIFQLKRVVV